MGSIRVQIRPFNPAQTSIGVNESEYIDVTEDIASDGFKIKSFTDENETELGRVRIPDLKLKLYARGGKYDTNGPIFNSTRENSLVRVTWTGGNGSPLYLGRVRCGPQSTLARPGVLFEGLINESETMRNIPDQFIDLRALGKISYLKKLPILDHGAIRSAGLMLTLAQTLTRHLLNPIHSQINYGIDPSNFEFDSVYYDATTITSLFNRQLRRYVFRQNSGFLIAATYDMMPSVQRYNLPKGTAFGNSLNSLSNYTGTDEGLFGQLRDLTVLRGQQLYSDNFNINARYHSDIARLFLYGYGNYNPVSEPPPITYSRNAQLDISDAIILSGENSPDGPENIIEIKDISISRTKAFRSFSTTTNGVTFNYTNPLAVDPVFGSYERNVNFNLVNWNIGNFGNFNPHIRSEFVNAMNFLAMEYFSPVLELKVKTYLTEQSVGIALNDKVVIRGEFFTDGAKGEVIFKASDPIVGGRQRSFRLIGKEIDTKNETATLFLRERLLLYTV